ncbi:32980_t:CDS:1, partial [Gigaspora margarita]
NESDKNSQIDYTDKFNKFDKIEYDKLITNNTIGQNVYNFDPKELVVNL